MSDLLARCRQLISRATYRLGYVQPFGITVLKPNAHFSTPVRN